MVQETIEIEHDGEVFAYTIDLLVECEHCGYTWDTESEMDRPTCPSCTRKTSRSHVASYHFFIKMAWWFAEPESSVEQHADALRHAAKKLEALKANGWEMTEADGEHIFFHRDWDGEFESEYKISEPLE